MNDLPVTASGQSIAGLKMRPFTLGTLELCRMLNLTMFTDGLVPMETTDRVRQVAAYLFIQSEPLETVLDVVDQPDFEKTHLRRFMFRLTPGILDDAIALIHRNLEAAGAMVVEIEPRDGAKPETAPPNS